MGWIPMPFLFLLQSFLMLHYRSTSVSHVPFPTRLPPSLLNRLQLEGFGKFVRLPSLPPPAKKTSQLKSWRGPNTLGSHDLRSWRGRRVPRVP